MSVTESVDLIRSITRFKGSTVFVVGIAGPGDPLANDQTFEALDRIHKEHPHLIKCMSTNGLLLEDKLEDIINVGISALTITINAADNKTGETIYSWINYKGIVYYGEEAANILLSKQLKGMSKAAQAGLSIKVNTVYIPGTNDFQMSKLANLIKKAGAKKMNIMPLIPAGNMINKPRPSCSELIKARQICERIIPQFNYCEQCRSDIIYFP